MSRTVSEARSLLRLAAECLEYPRAERTHTLPEALRRIELFAAFEDRLGGLTPEMRQEHYVRTFDVTPKTSLYLSVHLFGEENFKRAELMAGFRSAYARAGRDVGPELPDHLSTVLRHNDCFDEEEWGELVRLCLSPSLPAMIRSLDTDENPYALALEGILGLVRQVEGVHV